MGLSTATVGPFNIRLWSEGAGTPLLYLHGWEGHPGEAPFLQRLAQNRQVLAPEHPGYGASTGFETIDNLLDLVLYYRQLVESWGAEQIDVVGHSLGGMFAAEFAALCPQLTRRLVLVDSYGLWLDDLPVPDPFTLAGPKLKAAKFANPDGAPDPEPGIAVTDADDPNAPMFDRLRNLSTATKFLWPIPDHGLRKRLPLIKAPTLVIHGTADGLVPVAYADEFGRLIPGAKVTKLEGAGHMPMLEQEDAFVSAVKGFLA
jgi:pimeloyl-ACP methyl ester carboxylesterase